MSKFGDFAIPNNIKDGLEVLMLQLVLKLSDESATSPRPPLFFSISDHIVEIAGFCLVNRSTIARVSRFHTRVLLNMNYTKLAIVLGTFRRIKNY